MTNEFVHFRRTSLHVAWPWVQCDRKWQQVVTAPLCITRANYIQVKFVFIFRPKLRRSEIISFEDWGSPMSASNWCQTAPIGKKLTSTFVFHGQLFSFQLVYCITDKQFVFEVPQNKVVFKKLCEICVYAFHFVNFLNSKHLSRTGYTTSKPNIFPKLILKCLLAVCFLSKQSKLP